MWITDAVGQRMDIGQIEIDATPEQVRAALRERLIALFVHHADDGCNCDRKVEVEFEELEPYALYQIGQWPAERRIAQFDTADLQVIRATAVHWTIIVTHDENCRSLYIAARGWN